MNDVEEGLTIINDDDLAVEFKNEAGTLLDNHSYRKDSIQKYINGNYDLFKLTNHTYQAVVILD